MMMHRIAPLALALTLAGVAAPAFAQEAGDWTLALGVHNVDPKSDNGSLVGGALDVEVDDDVKPTISVEYFVRQNLGIEVLASWPFEHDIAIKGLGRVGSTKHLPPTISVQYHFDAGAVRPFVGAGINYTRFFSEETTGALAGAEIELDASVGLAAHVGVDFDVGERGAIRLDARWMDIDTDVKLNGADIGTVEIDPITYGAAYVLKF
jgi:outer membrane protein